MLGLVPPFPIPAAVWKGVAVAVAAGAALWWAYDAGQDSKQGQMDALRQSYEVAAAQAAAREAERVRQNVERVNSAEAKAVQHAKVRDRNFNDALDRMRDAYNSTRGLRLAPGSTAICPADSFGTKAELLREAETLIGAIRDADKDRSGLETAVSAWPR